MYIGFSDAVPSRTMAYLFLVLLIAVASWFVFRGLDLVGTKEMGKVRSFFRVSAYFIAAFAFIFYGWHVLGVVMDGVVGASTCADALRAQGVSESSEVRGYSASLSPVGFECRYGLGSRYKLPMDFVNNTFWGLLIVAWIIKFFATRGAAVTPATSGAVTPQADGGESTPGACCAERTQGVGSAENSGTLGQGDPVQAR